MPNGMKNHPSTRVNVYHMECHCGFMRQSITKKGNDMINRLHKKNCKYIKEGKVGGELSHIPLGSRWLHVQQKNKLNKVEYSGYNDK